MRFLAAVSSMPCSMSSVQICSAMPTPRPRPRSPETPGRSRIHFGFHGRQNTGQSDGTRALDIIVERDHLVRYWSRTENAVCLEKSSHWHMGLWGTLFKGVDEFFNEPVIGLSCQAFVAPAQIPGVIQQCLIVGSHIREMGRQCQERCPRPGCTASVYPGRWECRHGPLVP